jgi:hypothetical protein
MWVQSLTARLCKLRHVPTCWDMKLALSSAWGALHCSWCVGLHSDELQVLCFLFSEVFCVKGLCSIYFNHSEEVFTSSWHLLLCVFELTKSRRINFTQLIKKGYRLYFGSKLVNHDKRWVPYICCVTGLRLLTGWINALRQMPFGFSVVWNEPKDHSSYC